MMKLAKRLCCTAMLMCIPGGDDQLLFFGIDLCSGIRFYFHHSAHSHLISSQPVSRRISITYLPTYLLAYTHPLKHSATRPPVVHPSILLTSSTIHNITSAYPLLPPESSGRGYISATTPPTYPRAYVLRSAKTAHIHSSFCVCMGRSGHDYQPLNRNSEKVLCVH